MTTNFLGNDTGVILPLKSQTTCIDFSAMDDKCWYPG